MKESICRYTEVNVRLNIKSRRSKARDGKFLPMILIAAFLALPTTLLAQGSITGTVQNANLTVPANGEISFFGFLDHTDEEVRIETCVGAGYDAGNWYDDFQNYLTKAPGNPYEYYFANLVNGEAFVLAKTIPANSFQVENIVLAAATLPPSPVNLTANALSVTRMLVTWSGAPGLTYHVYRRAATSNGSFFRLDNPLGNLAAPGVSDTFFVDPNVDGVSSYTYMIVAQTAIGTFSPHSLPVTGNSATPLAPIVTSISPTSGVVQGGTLVNIYGFSFDAAGATVTFGTSSATSVTVLSPQHITARTPAGTGLVDVTVTNTGSTLHGTLAASYTYFPNNSPVANAGPDQLGQFKNITITLDGSLSHDIDGDTIHYHWRQISGPVTVALSDSTIAKPTFIANTNGDYYFELKVTDPYSISTPDSVRIQVIERAPILATIGPKSVAEGGNLNFIATAVDPDSTIPTMTAVNLPANATYINNLNGTGAFNFSPNFTQAGVYNVTFIASDGVLADSEIVAITVTDAGNQPPILAAIGAKTVNEGANLNFVVTATDADSTKPTLTAVNMPANATLTDHANGTATFNFNPTFFQAGVYNVTYIASDGVLADSEIVVITVVNVNSPPVLANIGPKFVNAGSNLTFVASATDPDSTIPTMSAVNVPTNATYTPHGNGTGTFSFTPSLSQSGVFNVTFIASDGALADSEIVAITVSNTGNQPPVLDSIFAQTVYEGGVLTVLVHATDDGGAPRLLFIPNTLTHYVFVDSANGFGTLRYTPNYYDAGADTVTFMAQDFGTPPYSTLLRVVITTIDVNQPPTFVPMTDYTVLPGDSLKIRIVATDSTDPGSGQLSFIPLEKPTTAVFVDSTHGKGSLRWLPTIADTGRHNFIVMCLDNGVPALSATDTAVITVQRTNQPPVLATIGPKTTHEGDTLRILLHATDPDGTIPFFYAQSMPANSAIYDSANGSALFTFTPSFWQAGLYSVKFFASDGNKVDYENVLIQVYNTPQPPNLIVPTDTQFVTEGDSLLFKISVTDPDSTIDTLKIDSTTIPINATFKDSANGRGLFKFKPVFVQAGSYDIRFFATDGVLRDTAIVLVVVRSAGNQKPTIRTSVTSVTVTEGDIVRIDVFTTDADSSVPAMTTSLPLPFDATFDLDTLHVGRAHFVWHTLNLQAGDYPVIFYVIDTDTTGVYDSVVVPIKVKDLNVPPDAILYDPLTTCTGQNCSKTMAEGDTLRFKMYSHDADLTHPMFRVNRYTFTVSGVDTTFTYLAAPANMTLTDNRHDTASFIFAPSYSQHGSYPIMFRALDEMDSTIFKKSSFTIDVTDVQVPPILNPIGPLSVLEGGTIDVLITGYDPDASNTPNVTIECDTLALPAGARFTKPADGQGRLLYTATYTQAGVYNILFRAREKYSPFPADSEMVTLTVIEAGNQAPIIASLKDSITVNVLNDSVSLWIRSSDPDGTIPTLSLTGTPYIPANAVYRDSLNGRGSFKWDPIDNQADSSFTFRFIASDGSLADTASVWVHAVKAIRGDANNDGVVNISDVTFLVAYIFSSGAPAPASIRNGDADCNLVVNVSDAVFLVTYIFNGAPAPCP